MSKVKTQDLYIVQQHLYTSLLNVIAINQRGIFRHQTRFYNASSRLPPFSFSFRLPPSATFALFFQITYPPPSSTPFFSAECSPNRRAFVLPLFLFLFASAVTGALSVLLPRYSGALSASYFLSSRPTFGLIAIPTVLVLPPPPSSAPLRRASCSVPLINSLIPCL